MDKSTIVTFYLEHDNLFSFKVHPKAVDKVINNSFQNDSIVAIAAPVEMGMIDVFIQPPKEHMKLNPEMMLVVDKSTDVKPSKEAIESKNPKWSALRFVPDNNSQLDESNIDYVHRIRPARCLGIRYTAQDLLKITILGKKDVINQNYVREDDRTWSICTSGGSLSELCTQPFVDETRSTSMYVHQILKHFGIAAASTYLQMNFIKL